MADPWPTLLDYDCALSRMLQHVRPWSIMADLWLTMSDHGRPCSTSSTQTCLRFMNLLILKPTSVTCASGCRTSDRQHANMGDQTSAFTIPTDANTCARPGGGSGFVASPWMGTCYHVWLQKHMRAHSFRYLCAFVFMFGLLLQHVTMRWRHG